MAITSNIMRTIEDALNDGTFNSEFLIEIQDHRDYEFLIKLLKEFGYSVSLPKNLLTNEKITEAVLSNIISLKTAISDDDVFETLRYAKKILEILPKEK